jgi:hypothetical protein
MAIVGRVDRIDDRTVFGWAMEDQDPAEHVAIEILTGDTIVARGVADRIRPDLASARMGSGDHAFEIELPSGIDTSTLSVQARSNTGVRALEIAGTDEHKFSELYDIVVARYDALFATMVQRSQGFERTFNASMSQTFDEHKGRVDRMLQEFNSRLETAEVTLMRLDEMVRRLIVENEKRKRRRLWRWF